MLDSAFRTNVSWFINPGTFWQHYRNKEYSPVNLYAATKQAFESVARYYMEISAINFVTLKLNDTYGPNDTRPKIFNLWKKIAETGASLEMSPGEQYMDIVHIDDVVDAYVRMMELLQEDNKKKFNGRVFAVSSGDLIKLKDLAVVFEKVTGKKLNILWGKKPYRKREVMAPWNKGEIVPGWKPKVSIEEGIASLL
jgi:nucleoside-diphosphate-sugar epimerase